MQTLVFAQVPRGATILGVFIGVLVICSDGRV